MLKVNGPDYCINQWLNKAEEYELGVGWSDAIYETLDFNEMKYTRKVIEPSWYLFCITKNFILSIVL